MEEYGRYMLMGISAYIYCHYWSDWKMGSPYHLVLDSVSHYTANFPLMTCVFEIFVSYDLFVYTEREL